MNMYQIILTILEKNGPVSFSSICDEMNQLNCYKGKRERPVQISHVKSAITRKQDLFTVKDDIVSIRQEKELVSLSASIGGFPGPTFKVEVDFINGQFHFFEWYMDCKAPEKKKKVVRLGTVDEFKNELYKLQIWNWQKDYQQEHLVLDGTTWKVKLKTKGKVYECEGLEAFPEEWSRFSRAINKLTGMDFN